MKNKFLVTTTISTLFTTTLFAASPVFVYKPVGSNGYKCVSQQGREGLNIGIFGDCGQVNGELLINLTSEARTAGLQSIGAEYRTPDFTGAFFLNCDFSKSTFEEAVADGIKLHNTKWVAAKMVKSSLQDSLITQTTFEQADLSQSHFSSASISDTKFDGATIKSSAFDGSLLKRLSFVGANLQKAKFFEANLQSIDFTNADLRGADFREAYLGNGLNWQGAKFDGTTRLPFSESQALQQGMIKVP